LSEYAGPASYVFVSIGDEGAGYDRLEIPQMHAGPGGFITGPINLSFAAGFLDSGGAFGLPTIDPSDLVTFNDYPFVLGWDAHYVTNLSISTVPIPAAAWLFASALGGLAWLRRR
jgi:hypothetical protein